MYIKLRKKLGKKVRDCFMLNAIQGKINYRNPNSNTIITILTCVTFGR